MILYKYPNLFTRNIYSHDSLTNYTQYVFGFVNIFSSLAASLKT